MFAARSSHSRALSACALALALEACGAQDGVVGKEPLAGAGGAASGFVAEFSPDEEPWQAETSVPGATTQVGVSDASARDGYLAELRFPGHPEYAPGDLAGAAHLTQLQFPERFSFGTYRTRLAFGACAPNEEAVGAFLGFFNDGKDHDGDGLVDDVEIDVQVACSSTAYLYLTVFTDYQDDGAAVEFRKLSRVIDLATGERFDTLAPDAEQFAPAGSDAALARPGLLQPGALYELGFEWHTDSLRFFLVLDGHEHELWSLSDPERIPQLPVYLTYNVWHPDQHWYPQSGRADFPAADVPLQIDWVSYTPE